MVRLLQRHGALVNKGNNNGDTPLHTASQNVHKGTASLLLLHPGVDVNQINRKGNTPLYIAAESGHKATAMLLLDSSADVGIRNNEGDTPLHQAS